MKKIVLNESQFGLLKEFLSSIVYHFTDEDGAKYICTNNTIPLTHFTKYHTNDLQNDESLSKGYEYYLSFTRQRNSDVGYASWKFQSTCATVRIQFNGDALNNNFKGGPVDYFKPRIKSEEIIFVQSEDRLLSNKEDIEREEFNVRHPIWNSFVDTSSFMSTSSNWTESPYRK